MDFESIDDKDRKKTLNGIRKENQDGIDVYRWNIFETWSSQVTACLSTRGNGVSPPPYSSLNLGHFVGDTPRNLKSNLHILSEAISVPYHGWVFGKQVHGNHAVHIDSMNAEGMIADNGLIYPEECDAFVVETHRITVAICLADCLPILLYSPKRHIASICHAGWRGTVAGIADAAVEEMLARGCHRDDIVAAVGPGIGPCCFPVSQDVALRFTPEAGYPEHVLERSIDGTQRVNLEEANVWRLKTLGLKDENIGRSGLCTACHPNDFFSYRKENGVTGRHAAVLRLK